MTNVAVATSFGGPEVLSVIDEPTPEPGPGEIRIDVRASAVNPIDHKRYSGAMGSDPDELPQRVGFEAAGVVSAVGDGATGPAGPIAVGDEVLAYAGPGAAAEQWVVPAGRALPKPPNVGFEVAAGLLVAGTTAAHLVQAVDAAPGRTILAHGAAGSVGQLFVQLAVGRGATVIATASPANHERLRHLGATPVAYGEGLLERVRAAAPDGIDAAVDLVGNDEAIDVSLTLVDDAGDVVSIAAFHRADAGIVLLGGGDAEASIRDAARQPIIDAVADGTLVLTVANTYPLTHIANAHREVLAGHATGKVVLIP